MSAVVKVYRWELAKLLAQKRTYLGLGAAMLVPVDLRRRARAADGRAERRAARPLRPRHGPRAFRSSSCSSCRSGACR